MTINIYAGCIMDLSFSYTNASSQKTRLIQDITDELNPERSEHIEYDKWDRLVSYWVSETRTGQQSRSLQVKSRTAMADYHWMTRISDYRQPLSCAEDLNRS